MAEVVIECPTPDEPQKNSRIREFLKKQHEYRSPSGSAVDSGNSSDDQQRQLANRSPPPNCSICLGRIKSKCFTDNCMHQFCFSCLLEWSKVKPECPLCKQTFKSIIHNVTSEHNFEEYKVEAQQRHVNWINLPFQTAEVDMNLLFSASLPTTYQMHRPEHLLRGADDSRRRLFQLFRHDDSPLIQRFAQTYPDEVYPARFSGIQWRQYIYTRRLYAEPLTELNGATRDISAEFYRSNQAQMHRLMPWLHRELTCFNPDQPQPVSYLVQRIEHLIQTYDMTSFEFLSRIRILVPTHTEHFIHELTNFARSPYDLIGYDRFVTYLPRFESDNNDVVTLSSSEEGSDVEFVGPVVEVEASNNNNNNVTNVAPIEIVNDNNNEQDDSRSNRNDFVEQPGASTSGTSSATTAHQTQQTQSIENLSGDDSEEEEIKNYLRDKPNVPADEVIRGRTGPSPNNANGTPSNITNNEKSDVDSERTIIIAPNNVHSNEASTSQANNTTTVDVPEITPKVEPNTQTKSTQEVIDADNGSDSDECLFVCAKKPPHLRTPEYVELNSDSDSDVVFVSSETCQTPMLDLGNSRLEAKSFINAISAHIGKRSLNATDTNSTTYASQNAAANLYEAKPSTSETMLQWLIQAPDEHSRRISPRSSTKQHNSPVRPRLTTTIKISRGNRIYESTSSDDTDRDGSTDPDSSSSSSSKSQDSSNVESSSHEEYVCSSRIRTKRPANNDGPSLTPRKKYRKRRSGKRIYSSSDDSDGDD
ncbi:E3 ubiquitin-protein ligase Topors-like isoform X2 [Contarinia nasturtii]|uniref:E3 ubiquitin-protein ligase Topors-like isoform X2 n=1 Tax=Contarinia nasturtii TaxID=265458 RepID=UPI0012D43D7B|nr:E3 ubiquitin-protein ligase Topors-like isoform X2 [Contarinia nasturtii]